MSDIKFTCPNCGHESGKRSLDDPTVLEDMERMLAENLGFDELDAFRLAIGALAVVAAKS